MQLQNSSVQNVFVKGNRNFTKITPKQIITVNLNVDTVVIILFVALK
jgi:hypothetical protein